MSQEPLAPAEDWGSAPYSDVAGDLAVDWGESVPVSVPITVPLPVSDPIADAVLKPPPSAPRSDAALPIPVLPADPLSTLRRLGFPVSSIFDRGITEVTGRLLPEWPIDTLAHSPHPYGSFGVGSPGQASGQRSGVPTGQSSEHRIGIWLDGQLPDTPLLLQVGTGYTLNFKIGSAVKDSLVGGDHTIVPRQDIPEEGLLTEWEVSSTDAVLSASSAEVRVEKKTLNSPSVWAARFSLLVRPHEESDVRQIILTPLLRTGVQLDVIVYRGKQVYREFSVRLPVSAGTPTQDVALPVAPVSDLVHAPLGQTDLGTAHEWTTPPGELSITVVGNRASVRGDTAEGTVDDIVPWDLTEQDTGGRITNVRTAAETFRGKWDKYLNAIDPDELINRLRSWPPQDGWGLNAGPAETAEQEAWTAVERSGELYKLAHAGRRLFDHVFPKHSDLRRWVKGLPLGHRLNLTWTRRSGTSFVPHVPWGLMYLHDLPASGQPLNPMGFMGLRFRLGYTAHAVPGGSKALGNLDDTHRVHFLYWGADPNDPTSREARRQHADWRELKNQVFVPGDLPAADPKAAMLDLLHEPKPSPTAVLYLFCQCNAGSGNTPELRFSATTNLADRIEHSELAITPLADRPLVFANACTTSGADPYFTNELESLFFERGCRGFLGTETRVPIAFASRFASIFFHFFYRIADQAPMPAGEAVAQARLFLWTNYRNIGGLLYTYINQYELFMADEPELMAMRRRPEGA